MQLGGIRVHACSGGNTRTCRKQKAACIGPRCTTKATVSCETCIHRSQWAGHLLATTLAQSAGGRGQCACAQEDENGACIIHQGLPQQPPPPTGHHYWGLVHHAACSKIEQHPITHFCSQRPALTWCMQWVWCGLQNVDQSPQQQGLRTFSHRGASPLLCALTSAQRAFQHQSWVHRALANPFCNTERTPLCKHKHTTNAWSAYQCTTTRH